MVESGLISTTNNQEEVAVARATLKDVKTALDNTNHRRSHDSRAAVQATVAFTNGEEVGRRRLRSKVAKRLCINRKRITTSALTKKP